MASEKSVSLDIINVASPCPVPWDSMEGDERVRYCAKCELNVYDLENLSRDEAEALVFNREGRLCVHFYRRADGTVLTKDCPIGMRTVRRQLARVVTAIVAMIALLSCGIIFGTEEIAGRGGHQTGPLTRFVEWIDPYRFELAGDICIPPLPQPPPPPAPPQDPGSTMPVVEE